MKQYIYARKCQKLPCNNLTQHIETCRKCELFNAKKNGKLFFHYSKWKCINKTSTVKINSEDLTQNYIYEIMLNDTLM